MRSIAFVLLAASALLGQDAKIIIVERQDTAKLKSAYSDYKAAQAKWEKAKTEVAKKYTANPDCTESSKSTCLKIMEGWEKVEFSVDFRALVPQQAQIISYSNNRYGWTPTAATLTNGAGVITLNSSANTADMAVNTDGVAANLTTSENPALKIP